MRPGASARSSGSRGQRFGGACFEELADLDHLANVEYTGRHAQRAAAGAFRRAGRRRDQFNAAVEKTVGTGGIGEFGE